MASVIRSLIWTTCSTIISSSSSNSRTSGPSSLGFPTRLSSQPLCNHYRHGCRSLYVDEEGDLVDAPTSVGDGFSFAGGKYSNEPGRADEWFTRGKWINAYPVKGDQRKAQDPIFGLAMGEASQIMDNYFRWFYVEEGDPQNPTVLLIHGFPSQALAFLTSHRQTMVLATQCKGFSAPIAVNFAGLNTERVERLILLNPPLTEQHAKLPSSLSAFTNFLLGDIFAQDPLKAGETPLNESGPYMLDEEDAMVYRRPYLTSGSAGFALKAVTTALKKELKGSIEILRKTLSDGSSVKHTSILWGMKDRWLDFKGVSEFAASARLPLELLDEVGHHAQEDFPEVVASAVRTALKRPLLV